MIISTFRISRITRNANGAFQEWQIKISLVPNWFDRVFLRKVVIENSILTGSYITWHWANGKRADYLWSIWAWKASRRCTDIKTGITYINSRHKSSNDSD
jgi:hypothetical protein